MIRFLLVFALLGSAFPAFAEQKDTPPASKSCAILLLSPEQADHLVKVELTRIVVEMKAFSDRKYLRLRAHGIRNKVLDQCLKEGRACTSEEITESLSENVEKILRTKYKMHAYAKLLGLNVTILGLSGLAANAIPAEFQGFATIFTVYVTNAAWEYIAPFAEPILGKLRTANFRSVNRIHNKKEGLLDYNAVYEEIWQSSQSHYSPLAQTGRATVNEFLNIALKRTIAAHQILMLQPDREKAMHYAAVQLAEVALYLRVVFKDLPHNNVDITRAIQTSFIEFVENKAELEAQTLEQIRKRDVHASEPKAEEYYRALLQNWFQ